MTQKRDPEVILFLGAGASVKAGVPDTYQLVTDFRKETSSDSDVTPAINQIIEGLEKWKLENDPDDKSVDVELLLEALDKMQSKDHELLLRFYKNPEYLLPGYPEKGELINKLRAYIKRRAVVDQNSVFYLEPLLAILNGNSPLDIFSVNYDILIEQFCTLHKKQLADGFEVEWNRESFVRSQDIRLYKLHGSVTWYKTETGDYVKVPVLAKQDRIELITGEKATSLILYPMHKWDYDEPLLDLLLMLKNRLQNAKYCIVIGYSFRDEHITRVFWDAARNNRALHLILVSPHSPRTYLRKLKFYQPTANPTVPSSLSGRVVSLPYKFEDIFFELTNKILWNLVNALRIEADTRSQEISQGKADWGPVIKTFIEAEHYEKITDLLKRTPWETALPTWPERIQYTYRLWLLSTIREDPDSSRQWANAFQTAIKNFDTNRLKVFVDNNVAALRFDFPPSFSVSPKQLYDVIQPIALLATSRAKMIPQPLVSRVANTAKALSDIQSYLSTWGENATMGVQKYAESREPYDKANSEKFSKAVSKMKLEPSRPNVNYSKEAEEAAWAIEVEIWEKLMIQLRSTVPT